jgi:CDP-glucose 4,6-dehydratase
VNLEEHYKGKSVLVTGHTGFKGSWLTEWLLLLGARVTGYSLPPPTEPALFAQLGLQNRMAHFEADIRQADYLRQIIVETRPDFVFHLAAQSLVRRSYANPKETYEVNFMGTVNLLEALRALSHPCAAVVLTTDKCYEQKETIDRYDEEDALGGRDPYSSSKAAAELAISACRHSFFAGRNSNIALASARAGNVLGGGDWASDRLVPDCIRSLMTGQSIPVRNPSASRPWQYVLDPLSGYLVLGAALHQQLQFRLDLGKPVDEPCPAANLASAFNFGPGHGSEYSVLEVVQEIVRHWPGKWHQAVEKDAPHETLHLRLATDKAYRLLRWSPLYNFQQTIEKTVEWYREAASLAAGESNRLVEITQRQLREYLVCHDDKSLVTSS